MLPFMFWQLQKVLNLDIWFLEFYADKQVARQADTNSRTVKVSLVPTNRR